MVLDLGLGLALPNNQDQMSRLDQDYTDDCSSRRDKLVKVTMEGVGIGRKVNLSLHNSYQDLFQTLGEMFPLHQAGTRKSHCRHISVTYEDEEGDWLLVGDVPWETFIESVKRLKILH